ncbi:MAG: OmpA family protein [Chitinophagaceae bacterium]|nr:OmpA family protein [Chitinophagaceae bacterium]
MQPIISCTAKKFANRFLLLLVGCISLYHAQGQSDKRLELADQYFAAGDYYTAAGLYEQFLNPAKNEKEPTGFPLNSKKKRTGKMGNQTKSDILFKQGESYRLANYWPEASLRYLTYFKKDEEKNAIGLYWYAVCQRSMGNYSLAEESIQKFLNSYAGSSYKQAAENELATLHFIKSQHARPDSSLFNIQRINTSFGNEKGVFAPAAITPNLFLLTSTEKDSVYVEGVNPYHNRLFTATINNSGLQNIEPVNFLNLDASLNQGAASISADGQYLYFTQWKNGNGKNISAIYYSTKNENGWGQPVKLPYINIENFSSKQPFRSADGKYLFFASNRPGGYGQFDIWYAPLHADGSTGEPVNAGAGLNTAENEQAPFYHVHSHSLVFSTDRSPGMGGYDLFVSNGKEKQWTKPVNMGHPINSSRDDVYFFATANESLLHHATISSDRGSDCCLETYAVSKTPKKKVITGMVTDCRNNAPVEGAEVVMKDIAGKNLRTNTGRDGTFRFDLTGTVNQQQFFVAKELYNEVTEEINIAKNDESHWQTDVLTNAIICMEKKLVIKPETVVSVYFDFDRSVLKDRGVEQLDSIYAVLMEDTLATIQISGYTDGLGSEEYNKILSDKRAKSCADYLVSKGIDSSRITFESFGACCPVEMEMINGRDNPDGRSMNRRALINITKD